MDSSHRNTLLALALPLALLASAGCGGSTRTVTVGGSPAGEGATSSNGETTAESSKTTTVQAGPVVHLSAFRSPSGNIGCMLSAGQARCDIEHRTWTPPARPASCPAEVDFGQGLEMATVGNPRFVCAGDTARDPSSAVLPYGTSTIAGSFDCLSATNGMTCTRPSDGHGFFLSIQTYRLF